jgi:hypothetical protein
VIDFVFALVVALAGSVTTVSRPVTVSAAAAIDLSVLFILNFPPKESDSCMAQ